MIHIQPQAHGIRQIGSWVQFAPNTRITAISRAMLHPHRSSASRPHFRSGVFSTCSGSDNSIRASLQPVATLDLGPGATVIIDHCMPCNERAVEGNLGDTSDGTNLAH